MTTTAKARIKRGGTLRMNVAQDIEERLEKISRIYGMPPSTLAALAVGQWVAQQERQLMMTEAMANSIGEKMGDAVANELRQQIGLFNQGGGQGDA
jgi:hypothetical protein